MLGTSIAVLVIGIAISPLPVPFVILSSAAVALAYAGHAVLIRSASPATLLDVLVIVTAHQIGFLLGTALQMLDVRLLHPQLLRSAKLLLLALAFAAGAFVLTILKDPPQSVASDPDQKPAPELELHLPAGLPAP